VADAMLLLLISSFDIVRPSVKQFVHPDWQAVGESPRYSGPAQTRRVLGLLKAARYDWHVASGFVQFVGVPAAGRIGWDHEKRQTGTARMNCCKLPILYYN
jgi:hypothetical protein